MWVQHVAKPTLGDHLCPTQVIERLVQDAEDLLAGPEPAVVVAHPLLQHPNGVLGPHGLDVAVALLTDGTDDALVGASDHLGVGGMLLARGGSPLPALEVLLVARGAVEGTVNGHACS